MADVIRKATNRFTKGLVMDFSPENTKNEVLTHALNATLLTFNGNELSLQNDMGNARVETAFLPDGYMPVGTCEYGGIIYIVSYNPLEDKSQIGCFPSPERNVSNKELGISDAQILRSNFQNFTKNLQNQLVPDGTIKNNTQYVLLKNDNLNPGDKFLICSDKDLYNERLADLWVDKDPKHYPNSDEDPKDFELVSNPVLALNVVSIEESGKIVYLNSDLKQYTASTSYQMDNVEYTDVYKYHILGEMAQGDSGKYEQASIDPDTYRDVLNSGYSVFKSKTSGRLAILAELIMIDSYSVTHSVQPRKDEFGNTLDGYFDVVIHTDISPKVTQDNYNLVPKLQYYHLEHSQGYLQATTRNAVPVTKSLYVTNEKGEITLNGDFFDTRLSDIFTPTTADPINLSQDLYKTGAFNFPRPNSYHGRMQPYTGELNEVVANKVYTKFTEGKYHRIMKDQIIDNHRTYYLDQVQAKFYKYNKTSTEYEKVVPGEEISNTYTYYVKITKDVYYDAKRDEDTYKDKGINLYKLTTEPQEATDTELKSEIVEKFQYVEIISHRLATEEEKHDGITKLYEKQGDKYIQITGLPEDGKDYYVIESENNFVSIGTGVIDRDDYPGAIYFYPTTKDYVVAEQEDLDIYWDFETYPKQPEEPYGCPITLYWKDVLEDYRPATETELINYEDLDIELWYRTDYIFIHPDNMDEYLDEHGQLFIVVPIDTYVSTDRFIPDSSKNYIQGFDKPNSEEYPKDDPISLYTVSDFIPSNLEGEDFSLNYEDLKLANIKIPGVVSVNGLDLPFKYDYTLVPCMNYGRLQHLAVSNTVDFSKLHAFNQSNFTIWKYHVDDNQLRLTFGAEIFDTYETDKVDALVLEFYDLWGFAGSIEISDKKSYTGIFTKIIPLNSLNALSKQRIVGTNYSSNFKRNINIREKETPERSTVFTFNGQEVHYSGYDQGWRYINDGKSLSDDDNDCGTLYSNILYGVKAYIRRTVDGVKEFTKKREFFLYTLPIYNDYYYTVDDFNTLENPTLDLSLAYKIQDSSSKKLFSKEGDSDETTIVNGYYKSDDTTIKQYLKGFLEGVSNISTTKYYTYEGISNVYLEVGLKKEYQNVNLSYSPDLNNYFSCTLNLMSENDESVYTINSSKEEASYMSDAQILGYYYKDQILDMSINKLGFNADYKDSLNVNAEAFRRSNFIHSVSNQLPIEIHYSYTIGYPITIDNIRSTEIQATTICALCHQDENGEYNYADFGIEVKNDDSGNPVYLSTAMTYNGGDVSEEIFGICRLTDIKANTVMTAQCQSYNTSRQEIVDIKTPGKLNSGEPLKQMCPFIGKLTFCQPHADGMSEATNGVNIYEGDNGLGISIDNGRYKMRDGGMFGDSEWDDTRGLIPQDFLHKNPLYLMSLNTKNMMNYHSEFIVTNEYATTKGLTWGYEREENYGPNQNRAPDSTMRKYNGLTASQLSTFNQKLLETMKGIYAYNPDYNSLKVNVGNVLVSDLEAKFLSNLVSTNAKLTYLNDETLNNYVYFGIIKVSDYIEYLYNNSLDYLGNKLKVYENSDKKIPLSQITFTEGLTYCGESPSGFLISSLTYNMPAPTEVYSELEFKAGNSVIVKKHDGENFFLNGSPNKKTLYGFDEASSKLIALDVSNYTIKSDGSLSLKATSAAGTNQISLSVTPDMLRRMESYDYKFNHEFTDAEGNNSQTEVSVNLYKYFLYTDLPSDYTSNKFYMASYGLDKFAGAEFSISASCPRDKDYNYSALVKTLRFKVRAAILDGTKVAISNSNNVQINLSDQSPLTLGALVDTYGDEAVEFVTTTGEIISERPYVYQKYHGYQYIEIDGRRYDNFNNEVEHNSYSAYIVCLADSPDVDMDTMQVKLYEVELIGIDLEITRTANIASSSEAIVKTTPTTNYSQKTNKQYKVNLRDVCFKGTSVTINDLSYEPNVEGHRLFIKNNNITFDTDPRHAIYYRKLNDDEKATKNTWVYDDTKDKNVLYLHIGPCYVPSNL